MLIMADDSDNESFASAESDHEVVHISKNSLLLYSILVLLLNLTCTKGSRLEQRDSQ